MKNEPPGSTYVYILECVDRTLYTGCTINIEKRIGEHNNSRAGARYTRGRRPVTLVYVEICSSLPEALRREAEIKKLSRARKLLLISESPDQIDVGPSEGR
jgi:putative endonuclease